MHVPIVSGIVRAHGGVLQTHEMPGMSGSAYVLEVPIGAGAGTVAPPPVAPSPLPLGEAGHADPAPVVSDAPEAGRGRRRARRSSTDAFLESPMDGSDGSGELEAAPGDTGAAAPTGRRRARRVAPAPEAAPSELVPAQQATEGSGRRRGRPSPAETGAPGQALALPAAAPSEGSVVTAAEGAQGGRPQLGQTVPPQGVPAGGHRGTRVTRAASPFPRW